MCQIAYAKRGTVSHIPVSGQHDALIIIRGKDYPIIGQVKDFAVCFFIFFRPFIGLGCTRNGKGKFYILKLIPQSDGLKSCEGVKSEGASAEKSSISGTVRIKNASENPLIQQLRL